MAGRKTSWLCLIVLALAPAVRAGDPPAVLPRYDLHMRIDPAQHQITVTQLVTWTNRFQRPTSELVFNAHAHYSIPDKDVGFLAKTVELLRLAPHEALSFDGPALDVQQVVQEARPASDIARVAGQAARLPEVIPAPQPPALASHHYDKDNDTSLVVPLNRPVGP